MKIKKTAALENVNVFVLNEKLNAYIQEHGLEPIEGKCRLVKMTLRHKVHHFPVNVPIIAAVRNCKDGKQVVFNIKRKKMTVIENMAISSKVNVDKDFTIDNVQYVVADTINGFVRYKPQMKRNRRNRWEE